MRKKPDIELPENTVADRLLKLRVMAGLTQEELCDRIGYTSNYYGQAERGAIPLSRKLAEKLRAFYHTTYEYLYFGVHNNRVSENGEYIRHPVFDFLESCTGEERDILYEIAKSVIRNVRDYKTGEPVEADAEEENR